MVQGHSKCPTQMWLTTLVLYIQRYCLSDFRFSPTPDVLVEIADHVMFGAGCRIVPDFPVSLPYAESQCLGLVELSRAVHRKLPGASNVIASHANLR